MLRTGKQTWKAQKSSWLKNGSKHQSRTDVFKLISLSQGPHAIIHKQALKEGGQDYCGLIRPGSAIENHVETLEMLHIKCKGAFGQLQFPSSEKSWFKPLKSKSWWEDRALRSLHVSLLRSLLRSPPAFGCSPPRYTEAGHKIESIWVQSWKSPAGFFVQWWHLLCSWLGREPRQSPGSGLWCCRAPGRGKLCHVPRQNFNPRCTQYVTGHNSLKRERVSFKLVVTHLSILNGSSTELSPMKM